jgi:hypothetical protein
MILPDSTTRKFLVGAQHMAHLDFAPFPYQMKSRHSVLSPCQALESFDVISKNWGCPFSSVLVNDFLVLLVTSFILAARVPKMVIMNKLRSN